MSNIKDETGKLVSSLMVHPEGILLFLRLHNLEDGVENYDLHSGKPGEEIQGNFRGDADTFSTLLLRGAPAWDILLSCICL